jgi:hypothetical protein
LLCFVVHADCVGARRVSVQLFPLLLLGVGAHPLPVVQVVLLPLPGKLNT